MKDMATFDDFWPHYVHAHRHPVNRALHYAGTSAAIGSVAAAALTLNPAWLLVAPIAGYAPAWVGHFVFEKNKPATFEHPLWSLRGDLKMFSLAVRGKMRAEVERVCGGDLDAHHTHAAHLATDAYGGVPHANGAAATTP
ncbi:MAG: Mpo1-like protein [Polyangiaceae bacterium]|jgi:hypothetical protein